MATDQAFYLQQWHPRYENIPLNGRDRVVERNAARWRCVQAIARNGARWDGGVRRLR